jgi:hypothetical protein
MNLHVVSKKQRRVTSKKHHVFKTISSNSRKGYLNMVFELFGFHEHGDFKDQIAAIRMVS